MNTDIQRSQLAYIRANEFLKCLKVHYKDLSREEYFNLREQALMGNLRAARHELEDILVERGVIYRG